MNRSRLDLVATAICLIAVALVSCRISAEGIACNRLLSVNIVVSNPQDALNTGALYLGEDPTGPNEPSHLADEQGNIYIFDSPVRGKTRLTFWDAGTKKIGQTVLDISGTAPERIVIDRAGFIYGPREVYYGRAGVAWEILKLSKKGEIIFRMGIKGRISEDDKIKCQYPWQSNCVSETNKGRYFDYMPNNSTPPELRIWNKTGEIFTSQSKPYIAPPVLVFDIQGNLKRIENSLPADYVNYSKATDQRYKQIAEYNLKSGIRKSNSNYATWCPSTMNGVFYCGGIINGKYEVYREEIK